MEEISVLLVGTGGYAGLYVNELLHKERGKRFRVVGAVDPYAKQSESGRELIERGVPVYETVEDFYKEHTAQIACIATPICFHREQAVCCMEHGTDVLCEKPICGSLEEAYQMKQVKEQTGRLLAIGFQWSFSDGIRKLKQDIMDGVYGKIRRIRTIVYYPRNLDYYRRGIGWAGKRRLETGEWLLDSVASNATAHFLHNMLFLTGDKMDRSAEPKKIEAEIYRANPIEMFDTCALRVWTDKETELLFYATHAVPMEQERWAEFILEGEKGTAVMGYENGKENLRGEFPDGRIIRYPGPGEDDLKKLYSMADAVQEKEPLPCVLETALPHLKCICALADSFLETPKFPEEFICYNEQIRQYTCKGLGEDLDRCWREGKLPSEMQMKWSAAPHEITVQ